MLLKAVGVLMMADGALFAVGILPQLDTFVYRGLRDQTLFVVHLLLGALILLSGRLVLTEKREKRHRVSFFEKRHPMSFLPASTLVAALVVAAIETTRFDWPWLVARAVYSAFALAVLLRTTLPKT